MKRIKDFINKHPKLKRIVKILGVVAIVFSFVFNALIIGSLIINAYKQKEDNTSKVLAYGDYKPKQSIDINDIFYISVQEVCKKSLYDQLMTCFNAYCDNFYSNTWQVASNCAYRPVDTNSQHTPLLDNTDTSFLVRTDGATIWLMSYEWISSNYWHIFGTYYYTEAGFYTTFSVQFYYTGSDIYQVPVSNFSNRSYVVGAYAFAIPHYFVQDLGLINPLYTYLATDHQIETDINEAYNRGIQQGTDAGYKSGYDKGYLDGLEDASQGGVESNAFTLISNAFHAIAEILNIQVLPHLTLGVLIFTPIIVTLIVVIVKMIRG